MTLHHKVIRSRHCGRIYCLQNIRIQLPPDTPMSYPRREKLEKLNEVKGTKIYASQPI
jgi:hypothetical protein